MKAVELLVLSKAAQAEDLKHQAEIIKPYLQQIYSVCTALAQEGKLEAIVTLSETQLSSDLVDLVEQSLLQEGFTISRFSSSDLRVNWANAGAPTKRGAP